MRPSRLFAALLFALTATAWSADDPRTGGNFNTPSTSTLPAAGTSARPDGTGSVPPGVNIRRTTPQAPYDRSLPRNGAGSNDPGATYDADGRRIDPLPPKPSEFQKFVEAATGRLLPVFGSGFFADNGSGLASPDNVPVSADYVVGPGDDLVVRAWGSIDVDYVTTVDRNGQISLPKIGSFSVAGVKASELEKQLRSQMGRLFTNFNLNVTLGQLRSIRVFVVGPAQRPGVYTLPAQSSVLSALVAAGGPSPGGSMRKIALRRDGKVISQLDVYDFLVQGDKGKDLQLQPGDVIVISPAGPRVALAGALDTPGIYELKATNEPLSEVLRYAGGRPVLANPNRVQLERIDPVKSTGARFVEEFKLDAAGLQKPMRDGDVFTLLALSPKFANAVTLKGPVAQPLRYPYTPGMRIRDLIPDKEALISPDFYRRKNLLVQVAEPEDGDPRNDAFRSGDRGTRSDGAAGQDRLGNSANTSGNYGNNGSQGAGMRSSKNNPDNDLLLSQRTKKPPAALFDELNWDYAVIERLNEEDLTTRVISFNLGRAVIQRDESQNLELMPGDVVTVYSQKDVRVPVARQTRLVTVDGEVSSPGVYQLQPGETLKSLMARAGGFTPQAYVYGLEFTREETRQRQRENLAAAIARLETLSATQSAREAANRRDEASADRAAAVSNAATQAQLSRLSRLQPNGRIALELSPDATNLDSLPEIPLENADRITVPPRPGFVTVAGAVVNSNAFLWKPARTAGDYLKLAGVDEAADPANIFILRADGTVTHSGDRKGWFSRGSIDGVEMQPGDALIVPNQLDFETFGRALVRNLKDYSLIFSQFGLGIAAIKTLNN